MRRPLHERSKRNKFTGHFCAISKMIMTFIRDFLVKMCFYAVGHSHQCFITKIIVAEFADKD